MSEADSGWRIADRQSGLRSVCHQKLPPLRDLTIRYPLSAIRFAAVIFAGAALASCGSLFESDLPAVTRYVIATPPPATSASSSAASQVDLAIGRPDVAPGLDTDRIAVIRGHELDYYRGALWRGTVLDTVQAYLVTTLQEQKLFRSVASEQARVGGQYLLDVEVRDFQAEYAGGAPAPTAHVSVTGRIIRIRDRKLIETIDSAATKQATENRLTEVASAFETAMQQVSLDIASRTATIITTDRNQKEADSG